MTKQIWANLPVKDVARTRAFFKGLGFKPNVGYDGGDVLASFLFGEEGFVVHFFRESNFKQATESEIADTKIGAEIIFTLSAESKVEVDEWADKIRKAGGTIFSEPKEFMGSLYGFGFADLDGHRWNFLYMDPAKKMTS